MDQVKIGKFISDERKAKGYTQKQLSDKQKILLTTIIGIISTITFVTLLLVVCFYTDVIALLIKIVRQNIEN